MGMEDGRWEGGDRGYGDHRRGWDWMGKWGEYFSKPDEYKFLPIYHALRILRGNSSFSLIAIAAQATRYAYGVLYRI